ncbi:tail fiber domain-containing protein [Escherichia coli]|nr:tail fiber domain-containing protein [Escherichia coli]ELT3623513.1 tail fiber domain-containing protein [Escherichia coli]ELT3780512.1 tail fiber domain-containing protein [Escherichia coli]
MYGGTGSGNAEDARTNLGIGPSNSPQFVNVALKRATDVTTGWVAGGIFHSTLAGTTGTERVYGAMYPETHLTEPDQLTMHLRTGGESKYASLTANGEFIADSFKAKNAQQTRRNLNIPTIGGGELTIIEAPEGVENGKYYPIIIDASYYSAYLTGYQIDIQTRSALSTDPMNCNSFSGYVRTGGWHDKKNSGYGYYVSHTANEVALQSICAPGTNKEHLLFVFVEARAFPVTMRLPVGVTATAPTSQVIYNEGEPSEMIVPWGASDPLTSYKNLTTMFDFRMARCGFYSATTEGAYYSCTGDRAILFNGINLSKEVSLTMPKLTINGMVKSSDNYVVSEISGRFIRHVVHSSTTANAHVVTWGSSAEPLNYEVKVVGDDSLETGLKTLFTAKYLSDGSATLAVEGNITCTSVTQSSDRDLKDNIQVIGDATEAIRKMNGYTYTLKENGLPYAGVIAQEVMEALPEAVGSFTHYGKELQGPTIDGNELREETRYLNVDYAAVTGLLVQVARETDNRVTELEEENASLRANIAVMDERITKLEALVRQLTGSEK